MEETHSTVGGSGGGDVEGERPVVVSTELPALSGEKIILAL